MNSRSLITVAIVGIFAMEGAKAGKITLDKNVKKVNDETSAGLIAKDELT